MAIFAADLIKIVPDEIIAMAKQDGTKYMAEDNGITVVMYRWRDNWYVTEIEDQHG